MTTTTIPVPGARLHVADEGDRAAPPVVLLHAGIADLRSWDDLVPLLLAAGYRVIRFDQRGYGRTDADDVPFSNRADVLAVLDALDIERAALVGNSRGGVIAIDTAIEAPERIVAVVGVAAGIGGFAADVGPEEEAAFERMEALEERLASLTGGERQAVVDELVELELRFWGDGAGQPEGRAPAHMRDAVGRMDRDAYAEGRIMGEPQPLEPRAVERLEALSMPVLMVSGSLDASEVRAAAEHLAAHAPDARSAVIEGVAHMVAMEAPDRLATLIDEHLRPLGRWR
jgi:3-oxoadipate enol-lactonase